MSIFPKMGRYALVGVINTATHWLVFLMLYSLLKMDQAMSNLVAFLIAVSCSFILNGYFTFNSHLSLKRYVLFTVFMGVVSYLVGVLADIINLLPIFTLLIFTTISFILGFFWSHFIVFKK